MTVEEFLALPDNPAMRRELIYGEVREEAATTRNPRHAGCVTRFAAAQVRIVDPDFHMITVHRPDSKPVGLNSDDMLNGEPELSGFSVPVARLFAR